jgi:hypothetical protein
VNPEEVLCERLAQKLSGGKWLPDLPSRDFETSSSSLSTLLAGFVQGVS